MDDRDPFLAQLAPAGLAEPARPAGHVAHTARGTRITRIRRHGLSLWLACLVLAAAAWPPLARAGQSWSFSAQLIELNTAAPGFPTALSGLALGQVVTGVLSYDSVPTLNSGSVGGIFDMALRYTTPSFSFTLSTPAGDLVNWASPALNTFVWNNQMLFGTQSDGVLFMNRPLLSNPYFQFGNLLYADDMLASAAMPQASLLAGLIFEAGVDVSQPWLRAQGSALVFSPVAVPEPATWAVFLVGLAALATVRFRASASRISLRPMPAR